MATRNNLDPDEVLDPDELEERLEEEGNDGILKDGQSVRVALYMKDGSINPRLTATQRGKAAQQTEDAIARRFGLSDGLQLHRPGFRRVTDAAALARVQQAYTAYDAADAQAYKHGQPSDAGGVPDRRQDAAVFDSKAAAYAEYDRDMANAWRIGK